MEANAKCFRSTVAQPVSKHESQYITREPWVWDPVSRISRALNTRAQIKRDFQSNIFSLFSCAHSLGLTLNIAGSSPEDDTNTSQKTFLISYVHNPDCNGSNVVLEFNICSDESGASRTSSEEAASSRLWWNYELFQR